MKIAYILYPDAIISNKSNGIRSQAEAWADLLKAEGVEVDCVNNWGNYNWKDYDAIHLFGGGRWLFQTVRRLALINPKIVWSPIYDPDVRNGKSKWLIERIKKCSNGIVKWDYLYQVRKEPYIKRVLSRSNFEQRIFLKQYNIPEERLSLVPLSYSPFCKQYKPVKKEPFCLHISSIYQKRKNVIRLIEAAKKYEFKLVLAGNKGSTEQFEPIKTAISESKNIKVLGFVSEEEKIELYKRAKVFALPSISEGVGIVAVDAAFYGCEVVITNIPGPKEYYDGRCIEVSPYNVDEIGQAISSFLSNKVKYQADLSNYISSSFSGKKIGGKLIEVYQTI